MAIQMITICPYNGSRLTFNNRIICYFRRKMGRYNCYVYSPTLTPSLFGKYLLRVSEHAPHLTVAPETQSKHSWVVIFSSNNSGYKSLV